MVRDKPALLKWPTRREMPDQSLFPLRYTAKVMEDAEMLDDVKAYDVVKARLENGEDELIPLEVDVGSGDDDKVLIRDLRKHSFVPPSPEGCFADLDAAAASLRPEYRPVVEAFRHSLMSTVSTVSMPFSLASASVEQSHFQRLHTAERIRADDLSTEDQEEAARAKANSRMLDFVQSQDGRQALIRDTCLFLLSSLGLGLERAAQELLEQGLALLWSALEVLCRDTFETTLNAVPAKAKALVDDPTTRNRFEAGRLPLDTLLEYGFDLSGKLGTVLVTQQDFSDLRTIKAVYSVLYPRCADLRQALSHRELWILFQRRHLVVHRRCVIDRPYLEATGETLDVGTHLIVTPNDFERALDVVISSGAVLARSISTGDQS